MESKNETKTWYDKLGWLWVIVIFILAIITFNSDPPILTVLLAVIVIAGCIMCFVRKYKLKFFTVIALLLGILCLFAGIMQARNSGWLVTPNYGESGKSVASSTPATTTNTTKTNTAATNTATTNTSGVDPDLKKFLDSYEAFIDEYVDFMKKYMNDPGNVISMLSEYTQIMTKYEDFAAKIEKYDSDTMSKEDAKYYLDVVNRCNKKMLDVY